MRPTKPFVRTVVWGEESPKTIVRMFFSPLHGVLACLAIDKVSYRIGQLVMFAVMARCLHL